ncbi:unnamed protein product, partial [Coregonus sp. 'balchen']
MDATSDEQSAATEEGEPDLLIIKEEGEADDQDSRTSHPARTVEGSRELTTQLVAATTEDPAFQPCGPRGNNYNIHTAMEVSGSDAILLQSETGNVNQGPQQYTGFEPRAERQSLDTKCDVYRGLNLLKDDGASAAHTKVMDLGSVPVGPEMQTSSAIEMRSLGLENHRFHSSSEHVISGEPDLLIIKVEGEADDQDSRSSHPARTVEGSRELTTQPAAATTEDPAFQPRGPKGNNYNNYINTAMEVSGSDAVLLQSETGNVNQGAQQRTGFEPRAERQSLDIKWDMNGGFNLLRDSLNQVLREVVVTDDGASAAHTKVMDLGSGQVGPETQTSSAIEMRSVGIQRDRQPIDVDQEDVSPSKHMDATSDEQSAETEDGEPDLLIIKDDGEADDQDSRTSHPARTVEGSREPTTQPDAATTVDTALQPSGPRGNNNTTTTPLWRSQSGETVGGEPDLLIIKVEGEADDQDSRTSHPARTVEGSRELTTQPAAATTEDPTFQPSGPRGNNYNNNTTTMEVSGSYAVVLQSETGTVNQGTQQHTGIELRAERQSLDTKCDMNRDLTLLRDSLNQVWREVVVTDDGASAAHTKVMDLGSGPVDSEMQTSSAIEIRSVGSFGNSSIQRDRQPIDVDQEDVSPSKHMDATSDEQSAETEEGEPDLLIIKEEGEADDQDSRSSHPARTVEGSRELTTQPAAATTEDPAFQPSGPRGNNYNNTAMEVSGSDAVLLQSETGTVNQGPQQYTGFEPRAERQSLDTKCDMNGGFNLLRDSLNQMLREVVVTDDGASAAHTKVMDLGSGSVGPETQTSSAIEMRSVGLENHRFSPKLFNSSSEHVIQSGETVGGEPDLLIIKEEGEADDQDSRSSHPARTVEGSRELTTQPAAATTEDPAFQSSGPRGNNNNYNDTAMEVSGSDAILLQSETRNVNQGPQQHTGFEPRAERQSLDTKCDVNGGLNLLRDSLNQVWREVVVTDDGASAAHTKVMDLGHCPVGPEMQTSSTIEMRSVGLENHRFHSSSEHV